MKNEEAIKSLKKLLNLCDFTDELDDRIDCEPYYEAVYLAIKALEQQPKTGHWRHYEGMLTCSECGSVFYDDIMEYCGDNVPKYCPDCGRRMVEPQESEDKEC